MCSYICCLLMGDVCLRRTSKLNVFPYQKNSSFELSHRYRSICPKYVTYYLIKMLWLFDCLKRCYYHGFITLSVMGPPTTDVILSKLKVFHLRYIVLIIQMPIFSFLKQYHRSNRIRNPSPRLFIGSYFHCTPTNVICIQWRTQNI